MAARDVQLDEVVGGHGGSGEESDEDLDDHHDEEGDANRLLWVIYSGTLVTGRLGVVCFVQTLYGIHGEVYHGSE